MKCKSVALVRIVYKPPSIGDLRPGSLVPRYRKCGKANCHCAASRARGHGPSWSLTRALGGKTVTRVIPADAVERTQRQIAEYKRWQRLSGELVEVSEQLCHVRLEAAGEPASKAGKRGRHCDALPARQSLEGVPGDTASSRRRST